jgi:hypothetical protein
LTDVTPMARHASESSNRGGGGGGGTERDGLQLRRLTREARAALAVGHPNVLRIYSCHTYPAFCAIAAGAHPLDGLRFDSAHKRRFDSALKQISVL